MKSDYKIVYFENYCNKCVHEKKKECEEPCDHCLEYGVNEHSHRPIDFERRQGGVTMANAKQCDVCKDFYLPSDDPTYDHLVIKYSKNSSIPSTAQIKKEYDLCHGCSERIVNELRRGWNWITDKQK